MKLRILHLALFTVLLHNLAAGQGVNCSDAEPFCTGTTYTFPNSTSTTGLGAINCLGSSPNPAWYFMELASSGNMTIEIEQTTAGGSGLDVDFVLFGPYTSLPSACATIPGGPVEDCSFLPDDIEYATITGGVAGEIYVLLLTNFSDQPGNITFSQTGGAATSDCSILCGVTSFTATPGACVPATSQYSVSGSINITDPPTTGTLTFTNSCGGTPVVVNAPFPATVNYNFSGLPANSSGCTVTASFSADPACNSTVNYTAPAPCTPPACVINNFTANVSAPACGAVGGTYSVTGVVQTTGAPATGTLTVSSSCGGSQVFNAPFAGTINYNLAGLNANGAACNITAVFSAAPACTQTLAFTAPSCPCNIDNLVANIGACVAASNSYNVTVNLQFSSPPAAGVLNITVCGSTQTFNPPFASPMTINFTGLPANGGACTVTAAFSASPSCTNSVGYTAPVSCGCPVNAGTFTNTLNGSGTTDFIMCFGDNVDIVGNGDFVPPDAAPAAGPATYDPGMWLLVYACPPTVFPPNDLFDAAGDPVDPCYLGIESTADGVWNIANTFGDGLTLYYVPLTMYSMADGYYSQTNTSINCYDLGTPVPITFLPDITANGVENCAAGTVTVTVSGGHPEIFGTQFTASNLLPASAVFDNTTCGDGGTIVISGLSDGDNYSFDITDANGCPHTFSGGPFDGPAVATITPAGPFCLADAPVNLVASIAGGTWSGTGITNATTGTFDPAIAGTGTHTITYLPAGCADPSTINITVSDIVITAINTTDITCNGANDGSIEIICSAANQFSIDNGGTFQAANIFNGLAPGTYDIVVQSPSGCTATGTATIDDITAITANGVEDCTNGTVTVTVNGGHPALFGTSFTSSNLLPASAVFINTTCNNGGTIVIDGLNTGDNYSFDITDDNGCVLNFSGGPFAGPVTATITPAGPFCDVDAATNLSSSIAGGTWSGTGIVNPNSGTFDPAVAGTGTHTITYLPPGCAISSTVNITVSAIAISNITATDISCNGLNNGNIVVNCPPANAFSIDNGVTFQPSGNFSGLGAGTYTIVVQSPAGCEATGTATIIEPALLQIGVNTITNESCLGACNGEVAGVPLNGTPPYSAVTWVGPTSGSGITLNNACSGTYTATVTDDNGCTATGTTIVTGTPPPAVTFTVDTTNGCIPLVINFTNTMDPTILASCLWDFGDGTTSTDCNPVHAYTSSGCFDVTLTVQTNNSCVVDTTAFALACAYENPVADFTFNPQPADVFAPEITFTNLTMGGSAYQWDFSGLGSSTQMHPAFIFPADSGSIYNVCLSTVSSEGCVDTTCHEVIIEDVFLIYVPNAFTPDGDGRNDIFLPILQGEDPPTYELFVFNRWGDVIFQSTSKYEGWDGTHNSVKVKEDVYVWKIKVRKSMNQDKLEYFGHITLLR